MSIIELGKLFVPFSIYPLDRYLNDSPLRVFQQRFPNDHYSAEIESFLKLHDYEPRRRGADLPWWGRNYFSDINGKRIMVISQDSLAQDAGSITFFAHLFDCFEVQYSYDSYCRQHNANQSFRYSSWSRIKQQFVLWRINLDFLYVTDASKVYKEGSPKLFDRRLSSELLKNEIEFCKPNLIILLGQAPLRLLKKGTLYRDVVTAGKYVTVNGIQTVVAPFPSGNGLSQDNFHDRMEKASGLIQTALKGTA